PAVRYVLIRQDGAPAATGLGVAERGWMGVFCVVTVPAARRQGLAGKVMRALAEWGETQGAQRVYLQVMEDNLPALRLYSKLGFQFLYQYFYSTKRN
ncbi:MAG: GNAT family N-acetyltransferase, partial [Anaerolineales bacterium]